jgi:hypothetical protein
MYSLNILGDGNCLFTSLYISLEIKKFCSNSIQPFCIKTLPFCFQQFSQKSSKQAYKIRLSIVQWLYKNLKTPILQLHMCPEDILFLAIQELENIDLNEKEDATYQKNMKALQYLKNMTNIHNWGSTPEYIAFSLLYKIPVVVWTFQEDVLTQTMTQNTLEETLEKKETLQTLQENLQETLQETLKENQKNKLKLIDSFPQMSKENLEECVNLLFCNGNHYEPLITVKEKILLEKKFGKEITTFFNKTYIFE